MIRIDGASAFRDSWLAVLLAFAAAGCELKGSDDDEEGGTLDGGGSAPRCETCVGEDGGTTAPPGIDGQTVAVLATATPGPAFDGLVLRGTFPVPPRTYPRADAKNPFVVLDWDGTPLVTQTESVSRYADETQGADVVEVLAKVNFDPAAPQGTQVRYEVRQSPSTGIAGPGTIGLEDLMTTANVPAGLQAFLGDPNGIEIRAYDCFGHLYRCRPLDGTGHYELKRRGRVTTEISVYQVMTPVSFVPGPTGTLPRFLGVHTYLSTNTGQEILGLTLRFNNGGSGRNDANPQDDPLAKLYFQKIQVVLPASFSFMQDFADPYFGTFVQSGNQWIWDLVEPMAGGKMHVIRWLGQFHRRLWISSTADVSLARSYADGVGQAFCVRGTDEFTGRKYWSWWNKGTARYFPQKFLLPTLDHVGQANLNGELSSALAHLRTRLQNGTSDGNYPISSPVLGWGHPYGTSYGGMTSGNEIFCYDGVTTAASASLWGLQMYRALHRMHTDRQPNALFDTDGEPSTVERWLVENGANDYVPFSHYIRPLLGGSYPDPFGYANAPSFQTEYVQVNNLRPPYEDAHLAFDPHDYQHFIRYTRSAKVLAWLGNDPLAKDDLLMQAEMFHLSFHPYRNDQYGGTFQGGLRALKNFVNANPGKGAPFGRGEAWGVDCALAAFGIAETPFRASKRGWFADIMQVVNNMQGACNGFIQAQVSNKAVGGRYRARQIIEQSITENMLQGLRESAFRTVDPGHSDMARDVLLDSLYAFIGDMAWLQDTGPWRYTGVGPLDITLPVWCMRSEMPTDAVSSDDFDTFQDWSSFAYGFEIAGDPIFFERALQQLPPSTDLWLRLRNEGTENIENRSALIALLQHENGLL